MHNGTMEITTVVGCKIPCKHCPQSTLIENYANVSRPSLMGIDTFIKCIDKLPNYVQIHFSGMSEPWQNPVCTDMVLYAAKKGHAVTVHTTLIGMTQTDFDRIKHIPFASFIVHLPDADESSRIPITPEYLSLLKHVTDTISQGTGRKNFGASCHGPVHPAVTDAIGTEVFDEARNQGMSTQMDNRAGHLKFEESPRVFLEGPISCQLASRIFNHNVLLPNGDVLLCPMDYGMKHILGNLLTDDYPDLFRSPEIHKLQSATRNGSQDVLCRRCGNASSARADVQTISLRELVHLAEKSNVHGFVRAIVDRSSDSRVLVVNDLESLELDVEFTKNDIVIISNAFFYLERFPQLVEPLKRMADEVQKVILTDDVNSFPETERLRAFIEAQALPVEFFGYIQTTSRKVETMTILSKSKPPLSMRAPEDYRVIALVSSYNEEDVIVPMVEQMHREGVDVYIIDNWSTDGSYEKAQALLGKGVIGLERFPAEGPSLTYDLRDVLKRKEDLSRELKANWFIHHDADEYRESPWQGVRLIDAMYWVDQQGYNAIDFTVLNFFPVDNDYPSGASFTDYFKFYEFGKDSAYFKQSKAWKTTNAWVTIAEYGGHNAVFAGRKIYPYKFLLRHYPIRSQAHGCRKIFMERKPRYSLKGKERGWHVHYDIYSPGSSFLKNPKSLLEFNSDFYANHLAERLTGVGVIPADEMVRKRIGNRERELMDVVAQRNLEIKHLLTSKSWRLTKPMRLFGRLMRGEQESVPGPLKRIAKTLHHSRNAARYILRGDIGGLLKRIRGNRGRRMRWGVAASRHTLFIAHLVAERLQAHGWDAEIMTELPPDFHHDRYVVICPQRFNVLPPKEKCVIFQMEQVQTSRWCPDEYFQRLADSSAVLEYALFNIDFMETKKVAYPLVHYLPVGASESYGASIRTPEKTCDVLFYGDCKSSPRRRRMLDALKPHFNVRIASEVFGRDMQETIKQARVVINLHYYDNPLLEMPRVQECLSLGVPVVSEAARDQNDYPELEGAVRFFEQDSIPAMLNAVKAALENPVPAEAIAKSVKRSSCRFAFMFDRFLSAMGLLPVSQLSQMDLPLPDTIDCVALSVPETIGRRRVFETEQPAGCAIFEGIRANPGWVDCGLSYSAIARHAIEHGVSRLGVMEDDVALSPDFEEKIAVVNEFLDARQGKWDVFAGVVAPLPPDVKIFAVEDYKGMTFVTIDKITSSVFNVYGEKTLRLLSSWNPKTFNGDSTVVERFLESQTDLHVVVALPFFVGHREEVHSIPWGSTNTQHNCTIENCERSLQHMALAYRQGNRIGANECLPLVIAAESESPLLRKHSPHGNEELLQTCRKHADQQDRARAKSA
jgi:hypothetical protein